MAEPDDVEEDLFADLYDADESTNRPPPAAPAPEVIDTSHSAPSAQPTGIPVAQTIEGGHDEFDQTQSAYQPFHSEGHNQNGFANVDSGHTGNGSHFHGGPEPQGTGIKEDG
ncbi:hypothetical protein P168DRAFT_319461 [Aspergillus campestris IBT 28561]|uniref:Uncharacterized protein n=1 Tax=Aspergillus campestris (strain IBT 28561) TaxID=1392248 RepID=A0A2I1CZ69_ASPC2|nr:uncharacterized protein P168DRAFT_319461 [Aspergillus campestris IBT 28561]PKY02918.1 hypothetical protein P168DRAFT_319461 [Aspergillus campestris IBT 28561]